jgi:hypothetical protein
MQRDVLNFMDKAVYGLMTYSTLTFGLVLKGFSDNGLFKRQYTKYGGPMLWLANYMKNDGHFTGIDSIDGSPLISSNSNEEYYGLLLK